MEHTSTDRILYGLSEDVFGPPRYGGFHRKHWPASASNDAEGGWEAEIVRYPSTAGGPGMLVVVTASMPGPGLLEILQPEVRASGLEADYLAVVAARHAATTADIGQPTLSALPLLHLTVHVSGRSVVFTGVRTPHSWVVSTQIGDNSVLIVGLHVEPAEQEVVRIAPPVRLQGRHVSNDERMRRHPSQPSPVGWRLVVDQPKQLVIALHVRDAAQLGPSRTPTIPALTPLVPPSLNGFTDHRARATAEWELWWDALVTATGTHAPESDPLLPPESSLTHLRVLVDLDYDVAVEWAGRRKAEFISGVTTALRNAPNVEHAVGPRLGAMLGHDYTLRVSVLPVAGVFGQRLRPLHVLVSSLLRADRARYAAWLLANLGG